MTETANLKAAALRKIKSSVGIMAIILLITPAFLFPKEISDGVLRGIKLCALSVIPSVFPFFIISDAIFFFSDSLGDSMLSKAFSRAFNLPPHAISAFVTGSICGFPIGVKLASELYLRGEIDKNEAERIIGFSNNPSLAFVVSAVGVGMLGSLKIGVLLYFTLIFSALITGLLFREKRTFFNKTSVIPRQSFNFVDSVKNAGFASFTVSSFIIFFSAVSGIIVKLCKNKALAAVGVMMTEISGGAIQIISSHPFGAQGTLAMLAAGFAFSGFSVHLQARSIATPELSFKKYYIMKLFQAVIAFFLMLCISSFFINR